MPELTRMRVEDVFKNYEPASRGFLDWTWSEQYMYAWAEDGPRTNDIISRMEKEGVEFDPEHPITLGRDGHVVDGHIRLLAARYLKIEFVFVRVEHPYYTHYEELEQEKEAKKWRQLSAGDWHTPLDMIIWEYKYFPKNPIPFSGDHKPVVRRRVDA